MLEGTAFFSARPNLRAPAAQTFTIRRASVPLTLSELIHEYYYYILRCATHILTCPSASVCSWQRNCRFGIGAAAWQACSRVRSCTPSADQCFASIIFETQTPRLSAWRWARLDTSFIPNEMALLARCFRADLSQHLDHDHGRSAPAKGGANNDALHEYPIFIGSIFLTPATYIVQVALSPPAPCSSTPAHADR